MTTCKLYDMQVFAPVAEGSHPVAFSTSGSIFDVLVLLRVGKTVCHTV